MTSPALPWLWNVRVQRVDGPARDCLSLTLFERGEKLSLVLLFGPTVRGVGALRERPKGESASAFVQRLRGQLEGARIASAEWVLADGTTPAGRAQALILRFERGEHRARIALDFDPRSPNLLLLRDDDTIAFAADERARRLRFSDKTCPYRPSLSQGISIVADAAGLFAAGEALLEGRATKLEDDARTRARAAARSALKKVERKVEAIRGDLARADAAPRLRREAQVILCNLGAIARGALTARLRDDSVEPPEWLELTLDPTRSAQQQAQLRFERARKAERGVGIASARLAEAERQADELRALLVRLDSEPLDGAHAPTGEQRSDDTGGSRLPQPPRGARAGKQKPPQRVPFRVFHGYAGQKILVGKGAADNDTLTLTVARPHDHWMHVRGVPGSHVVVPLERKAVIGQELLLDAAHLAAHFSKQRGEPTVEIAHTEKRFVRKPKGAPAGSVNVDRERVFVLRIEHERLSRLLAGEQG